MKPSNTKLDGPGFALIEMIGVLAIIAILAGAIAPTLFSNLERAEGDREALKLQEIAQGIRDYYLDPTTLGQLPAIATWEADLLPHVGLTQEQILTNGRDVARVYEHVYGAAVDANDISFIPRITISSHLLLGGDALPADFAGANGCIGAALEAASPCDPADVPFSANVADREIRVVNINLAKERQQVIDDVKTRYLAPAAALFAGLSPDVCNGITDSGAGAGYGLDGLDLAGELPANITGSALIKKDPWNDVADPDSAIQVSKIGTLVTVWSMGPSGALAGPDAAGVMSHPLYVNVNCAAGSDLEQAYTRISNAIIGDLIADPLLNLPPDNDLSGLGIDLADPWGTDIVFTRIDAAEADLATGDGYRLTSANSAETLVMTVEELSGLMASVGKAYPIPDEADTAAECDAATVYINANCTNLLEYLTDANNCNDNIATNRICSMNGM